MDTSNPSKSLSSISFPEIRRQYDRSMPVHWKYLEGSGSGAKDWIRNYKTQLPKLRTRVRFSSPAPRILVANALIAWVREEPWVTASDQYCPVLHAHICPQYARCMPESIYIADSDFRCGQMGRVVSECLTTRKTPQRILPKRGT